MDWNEARDRYLSNIVRRFPDGEHAEWAAERIAWIDAREAERRMERDERLGRTDKWTQAQRRYDEAREFEEFGDYATALDKFRAIISLFRDSEEDRPIVMLAREGAMRIRNSGGGSSPLREFLDAKMAEASTAYERARIAEAKLKWESIVELYGSHPDAASIVAEAQERLDQLQRR